MKQALSRKDRHRALVVVLGGLALGLGARLAALLGPGEVEDGDGEERVAVNSVSMRLPIPRRRTYCA